MLLTIETCTTALRAAATNYKAAIQLELSVGLAVFHMHGGTSSEARAMLKTVYSESGWSCMKFADADYKTVNRRINATASLYEKVPVAKWVGQLTEMSVIQAICEGLEPYELYTVQDVLRYAAPQKVKAKTQVQPSPSLLDGPTEPAKNNTGQERILQQFRRAGDQMRDGVQRVATEHLTLTVPKETPRAEIIELAMQLLSLVKDSEKEKLLTV